jgi:hypothetical protein
MSKKFYTERDIEEMFKGGIVSLDASDDVVLTELAYEKAGSLGMRLVRSQPDHPPGAPVRPYISRGQEQHRDAPSVAAAVHAPSRAGGSTGAPAEPSQLHQRIRSAVSARLGAQVDANLLDVIIKRVLNNTGVRKPVCCSAESGAPQCAPSNPAVPRG